jgi:hypothetical protein
MLLHCAHRILFHQLLHATSFALNLNHSLVPDKLILGARRHEVDNVFVRLIE